MGLLFLLIWVILFWFNKNVRKEMLFMSILLGAVSPFGEYVYLHDWWKPLTITNTPIGVEDFIFGFAFGGIAAIIYEVMLRKKQKSKRKTNKRKQNNNLIIVLLIMAFLFFGGFVFTNLNTFYLTLISFLVGTLIIFIQRKDLIYNSLLTGLLVTVMGVIVFTILGLLTPGWIDQFLLFQNIPKLIVFNMALDDLVWFFVLGLFFGPLYEYFKEVRLE
nr:hypothetical protein [Nanoarchaeum sp.]